MISNTEKTQVIEKEIDVIDGCYGEDLIVSEDEFERFTGRELVFRPIDRESMNEIWPLLEKDSPQTTDFSYGGILMWVDYFHYEYAIYEDTLFIKGRLEDNVGKVAFSHPVGKLPLSKAVAVLKAYCALSGDPLEFSAVPEKYVDDYRSLSPLFISELESWADYLYDARDLATLKGKRYSKKRNHVNQFESLYPGWSLQIMSRNDIEDCERLLDKLDVSSEESEMAREEMELTHSVLSTMKNGDTRFIGATLHAGDEICAFTIGDIKGDTLFVHIEKALRNYPGSFEMINKAFVEFILTLYPEIEFVNREDDAGDEGLRRAKESYRPIDKLKKYNIIF